MLLLYSPFFACPSHTHTRSQREKGQGHKQISVIVVLCTHLFSHAHHIHTPGLEEKKGPDFKLFTRREKTKGAPITCARLNRTTASLDALRFEASAHYQAGSCTLKKMGEFQKEMLVMTPVEYLTFYKRKKVKRTSFLLQKIDGITLLRRRLFDGTVLL